MTVKLAIMGIITKKIMIFVYMTNISMIVLKNKYVLPVKVNIINICRDRFSYDAQGVVLESTLQSMGGAA